MKTILKHFIIDTVSLYLISLVVTGIVFEKGIETLLLTGFVLMLTSLIVRPVINLLLLPINLITFGLFKWVTYVVTLYLVTLIVPGFKLLNFVFNGFSSAWFSIPTISLTGFLALFAFSFLISFISSLVYWIFK
jgi:putative membrane protein